MWLHSRGERHDAYKDEEEAEGASSTAPPSELGSIADMSSYELGPIAELSGRIAEVSSSCHGSPLARVSHDRARDPARAPVRAPLAACNVTGNASRPASSGKGPAEASPSELGTRRTSELGTGRAAPPRAAAPLANAAAVPPPHAAVDATQRRLAGADDDALQLQAVTIALSQAGPTAEPASTLDARYADHNLHPSPNPPQIPIETLRAGQAHSRRSGRASSRCSSTMQSTGAAGAPSDPSGTGTGAAIAAVSVCSELPPAPATVDAAADERTQPLYK
jgi:hypothetical protein